MTLDDLYVAPRERKMPITHENFRECYCSFCGKNQIEVRVLIAGPKVFICDECVVLCVYAVEDSHERARRRAYDEQRAWLRDHVLNTTATITVRPGPVTTDESGRPITRPAPSVGAKPIPSRPITKGGQSTKKSLAILGLIELVFIFALLVGWHYTHS